jgi:hypothetical protein
MKSFTKIFLIAGLCLLALTAWMAARRGWGLPALRDPQTIQAAKFKGNCSDWQKDKYGNCPPRTHRARLGVRSYAQGGGK